jgi:hypothetical protein
MRTIDDIIDSIHTQEHDRALPPKHHGLSPAQRAFDLAIGVEEQELDPIERVRKQAEEALDFEMRTALTDAAETHNLGKHILDSMMERIRAKRDNRAAKEPAIGNSRTVDCSPDAVKASLEECIAALRAARAARISEANKPGDAWVDQEPFHVEKHIKSIIIRTGRSGIFRIVAWSSVDGIFWWVFRVFNGRQSRCTEPTPKTYFGNKKWGSWIVMNDEAPVSMMAGGVPSGDAERLKSAMNAEAREWLNDGLAILAPRPE